MLVYATRLWFDSTVDLKEPLAVVARWLSRKVGKQLSSTPFLQGVDRGFDGAQHVRSIAAVDELPRVLSISYSHPDDKVMGRLWVTEIGFRQLAEGAPTECSILLTTNEISTRVAGEVQVSRPGLVTELVRRCRLSSETRGVSIHTLDDEAVDAFRHVVADARRIHSLVVLSPDARAAYLADPQQLSSMLLGLADIVVIPPGSDTFWLARAIGQEYVPYNGAAKLIYPPVRRLNGGVVPTRTLTRADADQLAAKGRKAQEELFSLVVHRSNLPLSWSHISPAVVREVRLKRDLAHRRESAARTGNLEDYSRFLEQYVGELEQERKELSGNLESLEKLVAAQDDRERQLGFEIESLKQRLADAGRAGRREDEASEDRAHVADTVLATVERGPDPEQSLRLIEHLFPDRVVILPSAWRAARESQPFKHRQRLYELLHLLATDYWSSLCAGRPDAEARMTFGASYAATESDRVANHDGARARRTFEYGGEQVEMLKHLKIGRKDSVAETIRVHFEWFADERRIVIGHCGPHIPFR